MVLLQELSEILQAQDPEERQIITGVSWESYEALLNDLGDSLEYRVTYLDGVIELMSPNRRHEKRKTVTGSLLEIYFQEKRIPYFPLGSTTFRKQANKGGVEPDESYCLGTEKEFPDLVIEIVVSSGGIDKLEVYKRLGVQEVWFFTNNQFTVYYLNGETYEVMTKSELLPDLDLKILAEYVVFDYPLEAALAFREKIQ
ncbi:Uma2 family endonuclease [Sphaerospermopsis aphanizomenoides BCCUSP55]|uniref:Uma2 family endonuclease n=1 Tax=Sphaerospermopsis aphanizomenoides TaxID=459663 RepID=UPI0019043EAB|nr:Uma2 family endonuclease [Sphaerospermopsis aphanizomenoides]MBK1986264.1 Uma2 family endonuclease [Sphaerospermopsis aphanizomenoides BCCUSP55]